MTNNAVLPRSIRPMVGVVTIVVAFAALLAFGGRIAGSQPVTPDTCQGDVVLQLPYEGTERQANRLYSFSNDSYMQVSLSRLFGPVAAGTYEVTAVSYDGYPHRQNAVVQPDEAWFVRLVAADGSVLATSASTGDLADGVGAATWSGSLGTVSWSDATAVRVEIVHRAIGAEVTNSVSPVCVALTEVASGQKPSSGGVATTTTIASGTTSSTTVVTQASVAGVVAQDPAFTG